MAENFNLIFGSQAPATATWSDADYQTGWSTVGSTPPTAEQFDFLQNRADLKAKELNDTLTPLVQKSEADGRQAGTIYASGACVTVDGLPNGWLLECVAAGTSGTVAITLPDPLIDGLTITDGTVTWKLRKVATNGGLGYRQPNTAYAVGQIAYHASLPTGYYLECTTQGTTSSGDLSVGGGISVYDTLTDGTVTWTVLNVFVALKDKAGNDLEAIVATARNRHTNYIKFSSGLIIQWGYWQPPQHVITFPISFSDTSYGVSLMGGSVVTSWYNDTPSSIKVMAFAPTTMSPVPDSQAVSVKWIAIGY